jgi:hypothetical protein
MANQYSWQDALANNYSAGNYGNIPGRIMPWSRNTVADGWWLNRETIIQLSGRDQYLLDAINNACDNGIKFNTNTTTGQQGQTEIFKSDYVLVNNAPGYYTNSDDYSLYISAHDENNEPYIGEYYLWPKGAGKFSNLGVGEDVQVPVLKWSNYHNVLRMGYMSVSDAFGNYVSAGNNQKLTLVSADGSLRLSDMQPGIIYLV